MVPGAEELSLVKEVHITSTVRFGDLSHLQLYLLKLDMMRYNAESKRKHTEPYSPQILVYSTLTQEGPIASIL